MSAVASAALLIASARKAVPIDPTEAWGFVTGAYCVYLVIVEHISNFPIGIVNSLFFLVLFWRARIYGDALLQIVYVVLGFHGWYEWIWGGAQRTALKVAVAGKKTLWVTGAAAAAGTALMAGGLFFAGGSAPGMDAVTTALSLAAQYLLNRKYMQNWYFWMAADVIYVVLYTMRHLYLTAFLYAIFFAMCVAGLRAWRDTMRNSALTSVQEAADA